MSTKLSPQKEFSGKTVLITGAASGLGLSMAQRFALQGSVLFVVDSNQKAGLLAAKSLKAAGARACSFLRCDLTSESSFKKLIRSLRSRCTTLDILINNCRCSERVGLFDETPATWQATIDAMLKATFFLSQFAIEKMKDSSGGAIVNISSVVSQVVSHESPSYHATKSAVDGLTRYLAVHGGRYGIRTNAVAPGFIVKGIHRARFDARDNAAFRNAATHCHPLGTVGSEDDVASVVEFLCSNNSRFVNGQTIVIDGGLTIQEPFDLVHSYSQRTGSKKRRRRA